MGQYCFFCSCQVIAFAYYFGKMALVTAKIDALSVLFRYNDLMHVSGHYQADKIEERITFALSHARLYLFESDGE